jgi:hypothetical protein
VQIGHHARRVEQARQHAAVIDLDDEVAESQPQQDVRHCRAQLGLDDHRARPDHVDVTLIELAEPPARRPVGPPHRLNLIALEELRQLAAMFGDDARERNRQVVAKRQIGFPRRLVLPPAQHFEDQLVAFFAVLAGERLDVLERWCLQRLEAIPLVDVLDDADDVAAAADVLGQEVAHAARRSHRAGHYRRPLIERNITTDLSKAPVPGGGVLWFLHRGVRDPELLQVRLVP